MNKKLLLATPVSVLGAFTLGATYVISGQDLTNVGTAAMDMATSLIGNLANLLPILVPILVVGFIIGLVISVIRRR